MDNTLVELMKIPSYELCIRYRFSQFCSYVIIARSKWDHLFTYLNEE